MMSRCRELVVAVAALGLLATASGLWAAEKKLKLEEVPAPVRAALEEQAKGGKIIDVDVSEDSGKLVYTSEIHKEGREIDVQVGAEGKLIGVKPGEPLKAKAKNRETSGSKTRKSPKAKQTTGTKTAEERFTKSFHEQKSDLGPTGKNTFFILEPGHVSKFEVKDEGKDASLVITVLSETKQVDGVETRIVEERESVDGKVVEVSRNYFAFSKRTANVYYFGEEVDIYKDGQVVGHEGAWVSGVNGAQYGLMMPADPRVGERYYQEIAPGVAMDRAMTVSTSIKLRTPGKTYRGVLKIEETTPMEPGNKEYKYYAPGVGLIKDGGMTLVIKDDKKKE